MNPEPSEQHLVSKRSIRRALMKHPILTWYTVIGVTVSLSIHLYTFAQELV